MSARLTIVSLPCGTARSHTSLQIFHQGHPPPVKADRRPGISISHVILLVVGGALIAAHGDVSMRSRRWQLNGLIWINNPQSRSGDDMSHQTQMDQFHAGE
jgi:hypothetical protein